MLTEWAHEPGLAARKRLFVREDPFLLTPSKADRIVAENIFKTHAKSSEHVKSFEQLRVGFPFQSNIATVARFARPNRFEQATAGFDTEMHAPDFVVEFFAGESRYSGVGWTVLPTSVIWHKLVLNLLFYFTIVFGLLSLPAWYRTGRGQLRVRRGCCPFCNYNRQGVQPNAPCPECGHTPRSRARPRRIASCPDSSVG